MKQTRHYAAAFAMMTALLLINVSASAYEKYTEGCQNCHGDFTGATSPKGSTFPDGDKHKMHNGAQSMSADCNLCHTSIGDDPLIGSSKGTSANPGIGCNGCHDAVGLRAKHELESPASCAGCHGGDPAPNGEDVLPTYYGVQVDSAVDNPCNPTAEGNKNENWTIGDFVGLDNDGDGLYDMADPDCAVVERFSELLALSDVNGNSSPDVGIVTYVPGGSYHIKIRDGASGAAISDIDFGDDPAVAADTYSRSGAAPALVLLGTRPAGTVRAQIKDAATGATIKNLFYGSAYAGVDVVVVPDANQSGDPELAVLGENDQQRVRLETQDITDGSALSTLFLGTSTSAFSLTMHGDLDNSGTDDLSVNGVVRSTSRVRTRTIDPVSGSIFADFFFGNAYAPVAFSNHPDVNGMNEDELNFLGYRSDLGRIRFQNKDATDGAAIGARFWETTALPIDLEAVDDTNGDGLADLLVLIELEDGSGRVRVQKNGTGALLKNIAFGALTNPIALSVSEDINGNGAPEVMVLGDNNGVPRVQIRDSISGLNIRNIDFP